MKVKYHKWVTRPSSLTRETPVVFFMMKNGLNKFYSIPVDKERSEYIVDDRSYHFLLRNLLDKILEEPARYYSDYINDKRRLLALSETVRRSAHGEAQELWDAYDNYVSFMINTYSRHFLTTFSIEEYIVPRLVSALTVDELHMVTTPEKPLEHNKLQMDLFDMSIEEVQKKYGWMNIYNYKEESYSLEYFKGLKEAFNEEDILQDLRLIENNKIQHGILYRNIIDNDIRKDMRIAHDCAYIKTDRIDQWKKAMFNIRPMFERIASTMDCNIEQSVELKHSEIHDALIQKTFPSKDELEIRSNKKCIYEYYENKVNIITEKEQIKRIKEEVGNDQRVTNVLKGMIASRGKVKGKVVVIVDKSNIKKVQNGDVLVAIWTIPDYVPAMKKASAIVTDEGGLTSHAAIIARELKKPCIIGTKIATKVLKDGDVVEVDADNGKVHIL